MSCVCLEPLKKLKIIWEEIYKLLFITSMFHKLQLIYKRILLEGIFREFILAGYHAKEDLYILRFRSSRTGET